MRSLNVQNVVDLKPCLLVVDDEIFNLEILEELLDDHGYQTDSAENGREACELLTANPGKYQAVLLDRMMPEMGGMEVSEFMKRDPSLNKIPIIMQSAKAAKQDIEEGLNAGILYYLTKPFARDDLLRIVDTAVRYFYECEELLKQLENTERNLQMSGTVEFRTLAEARKHAIALAHLADNPGKTVTGLYELFVNAIEHGNLEIGYTLKSQLQESSSWLSEIERRLQLQENQDKFVGVEYQIEDGIVSYTVTDQGSGFNFREYLEVNTTRNLNTVGRGISIARILCFDKLSYCKPGNRVVVQSKAASRG
jgi:CheY-like chemotaxis protein